MPNYFNVRRQKCGVVGGFERTKGNWDQHFILENVFILGLQIFDQSKASHVKISVRNSQYHHVPIYNRFRRSKIKIIQSEKKHQRVLEQNNCFHQYMLHQFIERTNCSQSIIAAY